MNCLDKNFCESGCVWGSLFRTLRYFLLLNQIHVLRRAEFAAVGGSLQIAAKGTVWL